MNETPYEALVGLVADEATGEFVCVGCDGERHVFLQRGRIAWAVDTSAPLAFGRRLLENGVITTDVLAEVLETCRRDRLPLGETLIRWKLATIEEIRSALLHQIRGALQSLDACSSGRTIFLERSRQFAIYDPTLTFALEDVLAAAVSSRRGYARPSPPDLLERLRRDVEGASWIELLELDIGGRPRGATRVPPSILEASLESGSDIVALRANEGTLVGVTLEDRANAAFCMLPPDVTFGPALAAIRALCGAPATRVTRLAPVVLESAPPLESTTRPAFASTIVHFFERAPEVGSAIVIEGAKIVAGSSAGASHARPRDPRIAEIVARRARLLHLHAGRDNTFRARTVMTREDDVWLFGVEIERTRERSAWITLDRESPPGLGWAYAASLARLLRATANERPSGEHSAAM